MQISKGRDSGVLFNYFGGPFFDYCIHFCRFNVQHHCNIIQDIEDGLKYKKSVPENQTDNVFAGLIKEFKISHYHDAVKREKMTLSADEIYKKIRNIINPVFARTLHIDRSVDYDLPMDITDKIFAKQLFDIGYLDEDDTADIKEIYIKKIESVNRLYQEQVDSNISVTQLERINKNAMDIWNNEHSEASFKIRRTLKKGDSVSESEYQDAGVNCLLKILKKNLEPMDLEMTNGYYYDLSDKPEIGWRYDWKDKYIKKL